MNKKILNKIMKDNNLDVIISTSEYTRLWYAKIKSSDGKIYIKKDGADLFVDSRYIEYCQNNAKNVKVHLANKKNIDNYVMDSRKIFKTIGVEKEYLTINGLERLKKNFPDSKFVNISGAKLREIKSEDEIANIRKACDISLKALKKVDHMIKDGVTEFEIDHILNLEMKKLGADKESFDSIVVSGINGSKPHGQPSHKKLKEGELVTIDFGVMYKGYVSDVTRTFRVGKVTDKKLLEIESILRKAQKLGIEAIKPGVSTNEIDKICRDYIIEKGYGEYFLHSTGHGIGIEVHELPNVSSLKAYNTILEPNMVITVEPGIYIESIGGIRVEDDILVTETGYEVLSK